MREVLTILGPTLDAGSATARREWCINTMATDPARKFSPRQHETALIAELAPNTLSQGRGLKRGLRVAPSL